MGLHPLHSPPFLRVCLTPKHNFGLMGLCISHLVTNPILGLWQKRIIASLEEDSNLDLLWTPPESPSNLISKDLEKWMFHDRNIQQSKTLLDYHEKIIDQLLTPQHLPPCISLNYVRNPNYKMRLTSTSLPQITTFYASSELKSIEHEATWMHDHSTKLHNKTFSKV